MPTADSTAPADVGIPNQAPSWRGVPPSDGVMTHSSRRRRAALLAIFLAGSLAARAGDNRLATGTPAAAPAAPDATELAKATQNPVAKMISVPFQNNFNTNMGPDNNQTQYLLNIQPVIPFTLNDDWNLITRTILPVINQPSLYDGMPSPAGLGDLNPSLFLSPAKSGALIWGAGPTMTFPTATANLLGSGKWSAGPAAVALTMQGPWVVGALANQQWSFAGDSDRQEVSQTLIQPFINYNLPDGWYHQQLEGGADVAGVERARGRRRRQGRPHRQPARQPVAPALPQPNQ